MAFAQRVRTLVSDLGRWREERGRGGAGWWRRHWGPVLVAVNIAGIVALGVFVGPKLRSPEQVAADAAPPAASLIFANAEVRIVAEPVVLRGTVKPGPGTALLAPPAAVGPDSVVTEVMVKVGDTVREGDVVLVRADQPMVALVLPFPMYRDLVGGMTGSDVRELQKALRRMGFSVAVTGFLGTGTQSALRRYFTSGGFQAPVGDPAALAALPAAEQAVSDAQLALDQAVTEPERAAARADLDRAQAALNDVSLHAGPGLPRLAVLMLDQPGRHVTTVNVRVGSVLADPAAPLVVLDGQQPYLSAIAPREQAQLVTAGQAAEVFDDSSGQRTQAVVSDVATTVTSGPDNQPGFEIRLTITGPPITGTGQVRIDIDTSGDQTAVLAVPISAIFSRPDGSTFVTVGTPGGGTADVDVTCGTHAGGWVEITPVTSGQVVDGTKVVVGSNYSGAPAGGGAG